MIRWLLPLAALVLLSGCAGNAKRAAAPASGSTVGSTAPAQTPPSVPASPTPRTHAAREAAASERSEKPTEDSWLATR